MSLIFMLNVHVKHGLHDKRLLMSVKFVIKYTFLDM